MFLKVFKYDFKAVFMKFLPVLIILPILAIMVRLFNLIVITNTTVSLVNGMLNFLFIVACLVLLFYTFIIVIKRYQNALFKDQGYLTHTLPVSKHTLLLSQLLVVFIMTVISILLFFVCIAIAYFTAETFYSISVIISELFDMTFEFYPAHFVLSIIMLIVSAIESVLLFYLGIALGNANAQHKTLLTVVFCVVLLWGSSLLLNITNLLMATFVGNDFVGGYLYVIITNIAVGAVLSVVAYFLIIFIMNKKLNLE